MLETKVKAFLRRHLFALENRKVVVGVSGGPDSLALLHYLIKQREKSNLTIVAAHVDHMFRGQESFDDALFVQKFCVEFGVAFEMTQVNVPQIMETEGKSAETAAREVRYQFYQQVMEKYDCTYLALGHHGDDQMETVLMRLTRGSTGMARAGIPFSRPFAGGMLFRPFLCLTKAEIEDYCERHGLAPRIDQTNLETVYTRNRFRHQIIPFLKKENPQAHEHFQRFSEDLQADEKYLQELTVQQMNKVMKNRTEQQMTIDIERFSAMPSPLQRRGIQLILNYLYKESADILSAVHIDDVFYLIQHGGPSGKLDFPKGLTVNRSYNELIFQFFKPSSKEYYVEIAEPGSVILPNGFRINIIMGNQIHPANHIHTALFDADLVKWPLIIRTRKNGDRMTLKGMKGSKKLKDIFIDQKIPLEDRNTWPVITDRDNCILWLPGLKKSSYEGMETTSLPHIQLTYEKE
ncbi:tRNA lysidine(34) synthetase TilS [Neobacillus dielmonensis]|uniref:tRNA lysidine(34) synthetase TilS n=1 Tax=Neobacillus dielmonensis TaxID=1347369 RepID=UPI0005A66656|nr:tRNA lysidine(34) synthetase TilS [Neobacillus dielmonensis]